MEQLRLDLRLIGQPLLGSRVIVNGAANGRVIGAYVDPDVQRIVQTILPSRDVRQSGLVATSAANGDAVLLDQKTTIQVGNKPLGKLSRIWAERGTGKITHVLFQAGGNEHVVSIDHVEQITSRHLQLNLASNDAQALPIYRDDAAIAADIAVALESTLLDPRSRRAVHGRVEDGHVDLTGLVDAQEMADGVVAAVRRVPGVRGVQSDIIVTEDLATQVSRALDAAKEKGSLGDDPEIEVLSEHQIVYLIGHVANAKAKAAAERAAFSVNGVRLVVNQLREDTPESTERADPASPETKLR